MSHMDDAGRQSLAGDLRTVHRRAANRAYEAVQGLLEIGRANGFAPSADAQARAMLAARRMAEGRGDFAAAAVLDAWLDEPLPKVQARWRVLGGWAVPA